MQIRHVKGAIWRVEGFAEGGGGEDIPIIVKLRRRPDSLILLKAWLWGDEADGEDDWLVEAWVEEHEAEILEGMEGEGH